VLLLAKNLFELREYKKCANMLKEHRSRHPFNQSLIFYYYYSLWMSGLIRKEEELYENCMSCLTQRELASLPNMLRSTTLNAISNSCTLANSYPA
jgi:anaphase-promoting complex subunit 8